MTNQTPIGILIMAYGGPNSLDELAGYLADIRNGRVTTPEVLEEITHNYAQIGGRSPLMNYTQAQIAALATHFDPNQVRFYLGMRHWSPWVEEVVGRMIGDGITKAVSMVLAPHYSGMSIAKYQYKIAEGLNMYHGEIDFRHIMNYHTARGYIEALARRVQEGLARWPEEEQHTVHVVFSAHSLPVRIIREGDPYADQLQESAELIAQAANLPPERWSWSYQSAGRSPEPWLGPQIEEYIPVLAKQGIHNIISIPIGFVCDHVEILYDIDIKAQAVARELGVRLERPAALNDDPQFIATLAELISGGIAAFS